MHCMSCSSGTPLRSLSFDSISLFKMNRRQCSRSELTFFITFSLRLESKFKIKSSRVYKRREHRLLSLRNVSFSMTFIGSKCHQNSLKNNEIERKSKLIGIRWKKKRNSFFVCVALTKCYFMMRLRSPTSGILWLFITPKHASRILYDIAVVIGHFYDFERRKKNSIFRF